LQVPADARGHRRDGDEPILFNGPAGALESGDCKPTH
jgi:hypothetical protein